MFDSAVPFPQLLLGHQLPRPEWQNSRQVTHQVGCRKSCDTRVLSRWYLDGHTQIELSDVQLDGSSTPFASACASARGQTLSPPSGGGCPDRRRRACCRRRQACACGAQHGLSLDRAPCSLADGKRSGRPRMTPALTHAVQQILARIPVAAHLATYLVRLCPFIGGDSGAPIGWRSG